MAYDDPATVLKLRHKSQYVRKAIGSKERISFKLVVNSSSREENVSRDLLDTKS